MVQVPYLAIYGIPVLLEKGQQQRSGGGTLLGRSWLLFLCNESRLLHIVYSIFVLVYISAILNCDFAVCWFMQKKLSLAKYEPFASIKLLRTPKDNRVLRRHRQIFGKRKLIVVRGRLLAAIKLPQLTIGE